MKFSVHVSDSYLAHGSKVLLKIQLVLSYNSYFSFKEMRQLKKKEYHLRSTLLITFNCQLYKFLLFPPHSSHLPESGWGCSLYQMSERDSLLTQSVSLSVTWLNTLHHSCCIRQVPGQGSLPSADSGIFFFFLKTHLSTFFLGIAQKMLYWLPWTTP